MRIARGILSTLLAILWLVMPVHCQLEAISAAALLDCASSSNCGAPQDNDCADDFCDSLESGQYLAGKVADPAKIVIVLPTAFPSEQDLILCTLTCTRGGLSVFDPPERENWRFAMRVVLPVRAPSPCFS